MPQQTKIFRVFVSSTFTDMKLERGILQRDAFPRLEKFCEEKGAKFQAVDLRWGVNEESSLNQKTLQICFNEIARCQKVSPKPNFLILLGDKYGWQPIPEIIPEDEMNSILDKIEGKEKELIQIWYQLDKNAIPPELVLQPKGDALKDYKDWGPIEKELLNTLRNAVDKLPFTPEQRIKYLASATHQEIIKGALNPPADSGRPEKHVFAFSRTISGLPEDKSAAGFIDLIDAIPDQDSKTKLDNLKLELKAKLGKEHFEEYSGVWEKGTLKVDEKKLQQFNDNVYKKLESIINEQLALTDDNDEILHEAKLHQEFKERLTEHFRGRVEILDDIRNYLRNTSEKKVLTLIGDSGSGKSSVMAQTIKLIEERNGIVVYRFIGTTSSSSNIISLLRSVCVQIARHFDVKLETLAGEGREQSLYDIQGLTEILKKCLALATTEKPILLFLDALDQLSETDNAKSFYWLPRELPEHARMVVSSITELEKLLSNNQIIHLPILPEAEARQILDIWFKAIKRKLTPDQYNLVITRFSKTPLAIYLKLAFEKAKHWHSYDKAHSLKEDVPGIINEYFHDLENEHTKDLVTNVVCYMLCGRYSGLAENEILEILVFDKEYWKLFCGKSHDEHRKELEEVGKIPIVVWSRLFLDLEPFLTERDADGVPIITFFHRQFNDVLRKRYGLVTEVDVK